VVCRASHPAIGLVSQDVSQLCDGDSPCTKYLETLDWATSKASNNSPWIRYRSVAPAHWASNRLRRCLPFNQFGSSGECRTVETSIMPRTLMLLASAATLALMLATPASAQLLQRKDLSLSIAQAIANGALDACKAMGYAASVVVVDRGGDTLVSLRGDGSGPHTVENARRKAYTANTFKMTTEAFIQDMKTRPVRREQTTLPHVIAINGGVPIKVGNDVIGGVGLSGSPGKDEECVNAGLEKVKQQLQ
jgi:uncharacterized protein GlcG (DUF336 family)